MSAVRDLGPAVPALKTVTRDVENIVHQVLPGMWRRGEGGGERGKRPGAGCPRAEDCHQGCGEHRPPGVTRYVEGGGGEGVVSAVRDLGPAVPALKTVTRDLENIVHQVLPGMWRGEGEGVVSAVRNLGPAVPALKTVTRDVENIVHQVLPGMWRRGEGVLSSCYSVCYLRLCYRNQT